MRHSIRFLLRVALCSGIAALPLSLTPAARAQATPAPGASGATGNPSAPTPANPPATQPAVMRLKRYVVTDNQGFPGTVFLTGIMPIDWTVNGGVLWKRGFRGLVLMGWSDAQNANGFYVYPSQHFRAVGNGPGSAQFQPGQIVGGFEIEPFPSDQWDVIDRFIVQRYRPALANATVLSKEKQPQLAQQAMAQVVQTHPAPRYQVAAWAGTETFQYQANGQTVQEMVSVVVAAVADRRLGGGYWAIQNASSRCAANGAFDSLNPISAVIFKSIQQNPVWQQKFNQLIQQQQQQQAAQQQTTFNNIENRISSETQANDAQHADYWNHVADQNTQFENEADSERDVAPWQASDGTTYKLPTIYSYAWTGADGTITMSNDPQYNPNNDPTASSTTWTAMQPTKN